MDMDETMPVARLRGTGRARPAAEIVRAGRTAAAPAAGATAIEAGALPDRAEEGDALPPMAEPSTETGGVPPQAGNAGVEGEPPAGASRRAPRRRGAVATDDGLTQPPAAKADGSAAAGARAGAARGGSPAGKRAVAAARSKRTDPTAKAKRGAARARRSRVRWTQARETMFLETLAETANVAEAVRASGLSSANVYDRRRRCDAFRAAWSEALREGYVRLETMLLSRAINGVEKPVWHGGRQVGTTTDYSDRLALTLLAQHRAAVGRAPADDGSRSLSEADARTELAAMLAEINVRLGGEG